MNSAIYPGGTIGVLGSGQLGRMFAIAARRMGYRVHTFSPEYDTPTGQVADKEISCDYDDLEQVKAFARGVDVVTFEFENVPAITADAAAREAPVRPDGRVLHIAQNRLREKNFLHGRGFPVASFYEVSSADDLSQGLRKIGHPAVLKTAGWGYDGKGQVKVQTDADALEAWQKLQGAPAILEEHVNFAMEVSVIAARGMDGTIVDYGAIENRHRQHILDVSVSPATVSDELQREAVEIAHGIMRELDVVGVLCVEFFITQDGRVLVNELAPRPHNSGHLTIDACVTSQFEQQLRAVCGLPLGSTEMLRPSAMANLLGDLWQQGELNWTAAGAFPNVKIHTYGKAEPRPGRKMGHLTALAETASEAVQCVINARKALTG